jgi:hypothetical protein
MRYRVNGVSTEQEGRVAFTFPAWCSTTCPKLVSSAGSWSSLQRYTLVCWRALVLRSVSLIRLFITSYQDVTICPMLTGIVVHVAGLIDYYLRPLETGINLIQMNFILLKVKDLNQRLRLSLLARIFHKYLWMCTCAAFIINTRFWTSDIYSFLLVLKGHFTNRSQYNLNIPRSLFCSEKHLEWKPHLCTKDSSSACGSTV